MFLTRALVAVCLSSLVGAATVGDVQRNVPAPAEVDVLDAIIVGGGPSGLSAASGLARVRRNVLLVDSAEYRNNATRRIHDVIGFDGVTPAYFRWRARDQLSHYPTVNMMNGTVTSIAYNTTDDIPSFEAQVLYPSGEVVVHKARAIVLATGIKDILPETPGLRESWAQGIYWCPWCDGYEHADQPLGILSGLGDVPSLVREVSTQQSDVMAFVNGTDTPEGRSSTEESFPDWELYLKVNNVTVYNQTIVRIEHLQSGNDEAQDPSLPTYPEYDLFRIDLDDGTSVERAAFIVDFPNEQRSTVGQDMGVDLIDGRLAGNVSIGYLTNIPLVYAVGDNNIARSTNVPHAMYSGKRAAVFLHVALARQESAAQIAAAKDGVTLPKRETLELDPRAVWEEMNGPRGSLFDAGDYADV